MNIFPVGKISENKLSKSENKVELNIVIMGGGKVGETLCYELNSYKDCNITLIEQNEMVLDKLSSKFDIQAVHGSGTDVDILIEAGVETCDFFIAVSQKDETNIIASMMSKKLGSKYTIARVRESNYSKHMDFVQNSLGISKIINPDLQASYNIYRMLKYVHASSVDTFMDEKVSVISVFVDENSKLKNVYIKELRKNFDVIICIVERENEAFIPTGESQILEGDTVYVTGSPDNMQYFYTNVGFSKESHLKSALIIGGGRLSEYLLPLLKRMKLDIKVIDNNFEVAKSLSEEHEDISVVFGDGTDQDFLEEMSIDRYDICMALTGIDEENVLISMYAGSRGVRKTITKLNRLAILNIIQSDQIKSIITPKRIISDNIVRNIIGIANAEGSNMEEFYTLANEQVKAMQFKVSCNSKLIGLTFEEAKLKDNTVIAIVLRGKKIFFPSGKDSLLANDRVLIISKHFDFSDIDDILMED